MNIGVYQVFSRTKTRDKFTTTNCKSFYFSSNQFRIPNRKTYEKSPKSICWKNIQFASIQDGRHYIYGLQLLLWLWNK